MGKLKIEIINTKGWYKKGEIHEVGNYITLGFIGGAAHFEVEKGFKGIDIRDCIVLGKIEKPKKVKPKKEELKNGDKIRVVRNTFGHKFEIGSVVDVIINNIKDKDVLAKNNGSNSFLKYTEFEIYKPKKDKIVKDVVKQFKQRSKEGVEKYGTTLCENNQDDFLQHLKEELMDAVLYIQKLQTENK